MSVPKECVLGYRTGLQSSATGFLMPDQRHFLSLYSYSLFQTQESARIGHILLYTCYAIIFSFSHVFLSI